MKRELKFRAWDGEQMIILPLAGLQYFDFKGSYALSFAVDGYDGFWAHEQYDTMSKKADKFPIMQYTGLKDKNGKEIYEGDICKSDGGMDGSIQFITDSPTITLGFYFKCTLFTSAITPSTGNVLEIIGNIYENPELLETKNVQLSEPKSE